MKPLDPYSIISVIQEKRLQNRPSKGRNQWMFLKQFDGKSVENYIDAAMASTRTSPIETYQSGNWWDRELEWNLKRGNIELSKPRDLGKKVG